MNLNKISLDLLFSVENLHRIQQREQVCMREAGKRLRLPEWELRRAFQYLLGEGLVERCDAGTQVRLSAWGWTEVKQQKHLRPAAQTEQTPYNLAAQPQQAMAFSEAS